MLSLTVGPAHHKPEVKSTGICTGNSVYLLMSGPLGTVKTLGKRITLNPRSSPTAHGRSQTDLGSQGRPASPPPRKAARVQGHNRCSETKCCYTGQTEDTRQKCLRMLSRTEVMQTLSHREQSSQYINNSKGMQPGPPYQEPI